MKNCFWILVLSGICGSAMAATWSARSERGATFRFDVDGTLTGNTLVGTICSSDVMALKTVKLWMPMHGHGSTPTTVTAIDDHCGRVNRLNFLMPGHWDMQVDTTSGDKVTIGVNVL